MRRPDDVEAIHIDSAVWLDDEFDEDLAGRRRAIQIVRIDRNDSPIGICPRWLIDLMT